MVKIIRDLDKEERRNFENFMIKNGWSINCDFVEKPMNKNWLSNWFAFKIAKIKLKNKIIKIELEAQKDVIKEIISLMEMYEKENKVKIEILQVDNLDDDDY
jgi:hypothetical protein